VSFCAPRAGTTLLTLLPVFMPALRWRFFYPTPKIRDAGGLPFSLAWLFKSPSPPRGLLGD
ncbi:hypothetical protein, partial [Serratia nevei]|uniref:hypothetical protein n=1 Tax=Serratia nevei TaxID=2703794 RepID=UPI002AA0B39C